MTCTAGSRPRCSESSMAVLCFLGHATGERGEPPPLAAVPRPSQIPTWRACRCLASAGCGTVGAFADTTNSRSDRLSTRCGSWLATSSQTVAGRRLFAKRRQTRRRRSGHVPGTTTTSSQCSGLRTPRTRPAADRCCGLRMLPSMLHAKVLSVDGVVCAIGSYNLDRRSLLLNWELSVLVGDKATGPHARPKLRR